MTSFSLSSVLKGTSAAVLAILLAGCGCSSSEDEAAVEAAGQPDRAEANTNDVAYIQAEAHKAFEAKDWPAAVKAFCRLAYDTTLPLEAQSVGWAGKGLVDFAKLDEPGAANELCDTARTAFMHAVRLDRKNSMARYHLGKLYMDQYGFYQAALEQFEMYVALMKGSGDPHVAKAEEWIARLKQEIQALQSGTTAGAEQRNRTACAAALKRGDDYYERNSYTKARFAYDSALKADPLCYEAAVRLAQCWEKTDKSNYGRKQALNAYRKASSLRTYAATLLAGAAIAEKLDSRAVAVSLYSKAVAASPTSREAIDGLVRMLEKNGEKNAASAYKRYRNSLPEK